MPDPYGAVMIPTRSSRRNALALAVAGIVSVSLLLSSCGSTGSTGSAGPAADGSTADGSTADTTVVPSSTGPVELGYPAGTQRVSWDVDGTTRTAVLVVPEHLTGPAPLVLGYHGHGGNGAAFDKKMDIEGRWPEAIVVYPDGLVGHEGKTDPEGVKTGWQQVAGDEGGRDLRFYDTMMADLRAKLPIDPDRIFVVGHSNGSAFTSLLLNVRGDQIAATANLSAQPGRYLDTDPLRSMFMSMGEQDPIVPFASQKLSIPLAEAKLGVDPATATVDGYLRIETAPGHLELDTYVHPAGHEVPDAVPPLVVAFFQRHSLTDGRP